MTPLHTVLIGALFSLTTSILTAFLTVRLSLRRFHSERWWEKKVEAYSRIIEALHDVVEYYSVKIEEESGQILIMNIKLK